MEAGAIGRVTASEHPGFAVGEHVYGGFGVQEFACSDGTGVTKLDPSLGPLTAYLGALGIPGLTAYFGLLDVGRPSEGDTVVVSGAAGGVGSVAGQIARIKGCRVIGIAGGAGEVPLDRRRARLRRRDRLQGRGRRAPAAASSRPTASTSSSTTSAARSSTRCSLHLARGARIVLSGGLSQYNADRPPRPVQLPGAAVEAGVDDRLPHAGLRRPLRRGARGARRAGCATGG